MVSSFRRNIFVNRVSLQNEFQVIIVCSRKSIVQSKCVDENLHALTLCKISSRGVNIRWYIVIS